jgi:hypothetical protein
MMGIELLDKPVDRLFKKKWGLIGLWMILIGFGVQIVCTIVAGALDEPAATIFKNGFGTIFDAEAPSRGYMLFAGGGDVLALVLFLGQVEAKNLALKFARITTGFRRAGLIALTIYEIQAGLYIPVILLEYAFYLQPDKHQDNVWQSLVIGAVCVAITILVSWVWEKLKFKWSLELVAVKMLGKFSHREITADRILPAGSLYEIEPLGQPGESQEKSGKEVTPGGAGESR